MNDNKDNVVDIKTDELREAVPAHTIGALDRYIEHKYEPGGFLTAVLQNKLMEEDEGLEKSWEKTESEKKLS